MTVSSEDSLLVLNLGSATLKAARFDGFGPGVEGPRLSRRIELALDESADDPGTLLAQATDALGFVAAPTWIGHRIVHGGDAEAARILNADEIDRLQALSSLAPMHQPAALALVENAKKLWPHAVQCGAYDTSWHATLPANTRRLPVPRHWDALGVRRYGFHGLAFASVMRSLASQGDGIARGRVVLAHLGGGASLCAVQDGRSVDTTMTMTPLDGVPMATRSGSLDPGVVLFLLRQEGFTLDSLEQALYHECGMRGISGQSGDMRELLASDSRAAALARDVFALGSHKGLPRWPRGSAASTTWFSPAASAPTPLGCEAQSWSIWPGSACSWTRTPIIGEQCAWTHLPARFVSGAWKWTRKARSRPLARSLLQAGTSVFVRALRYLAPSVGASHASPRPGPGPARATTTPAGTGPAAAARNGRDALVPRSG